MMQASLLPDETLADVLGSRAERTPTARLLLDAAGGVLIAAAAIWARPLGWVVLAAVAMCFACYGVWALAHRRLRTADAPGVWPVLARVAGGLGVAAFVFLLFAILGFALGRQIS
jgi:uncharacterized membrane protein YhaH (DUF805 family)